MHSCKMCEPVYECNLQFVVKKFISLVLDRGRGIYNNQSPSIADGMDGKRNQDTTIWVQEDISALHLRVYQAAIWTKKSTCSAVAARWRQSESALHSAINLMQAPFLNRSQVHNNVILALSLSDIYNYELSSLIIY